MANVAATVAMDDEREVEVTDVATVLESLTRGEIDAQVRTAKAYPRSIKTFINEARDMACLDEDTAASCIYALPRGGKPIEGPSARLAEIVASAWGNCRVGARVVSEDDRFVTSQGYFFDVQRNYAVAFDVRRRITDKHGKRFNDDMVGVTSNAACSIALRNAVFKGVPKAFWGRIYDEARKTAIGDAKTLEAKRADMIGYFGKMGVTPDRILAAIGSPSVEDLGADELVTLKGIATAIKEGETTIEQSFPSGPRPATSGGAVKLDDVLGAKTTVEDKPANKEAQKSVKQEVPTGEPNPQGRTAANCRTIIEELNAYRPKFGDNFAESLGVENLDEMAIEALEHLQSELATELNRVHQLPPETKAAAESGKAKKPQGKLL